MIWSRIFIYILILTQLVAFVMLCPLSLCEERGTPLVDESSLIERIPRGPPYGFALGMVGFKKFFYFLRYYHIIFIAGKVNRILPKSIFLRKNDFFQNWHSGVGFLKRITGKTILK